MLCEAERRMTIDQLKIHPVSLEIPSFRHVLTTFQFFHGVDWATIREIDAPFVPHLRSITDTSYFPTNELDQVPEVLSSADMGSDATKDLALDRKSVV